MKKMYAVLLVLACAAATLVGAASSASAYGGYSASASNVDYLSDRCFTSHITVSGFDPSYDADGHEIEVVGPDGSYVDSDYAYGSYSESLSPLLCNGMDVTGRYSVRVDGREVTSFTVARPAISVRVVAPRTKRAYVQGRVSLRGRALAGRRVKVQYRSYGYWYDSTAFTSRRDGTVGLQCRKRGYQRACAKGLFRFTHNGVAVSRAFHLPTRRR